ncbi:hypothetical protein AB21_4629 [Escherichia coli 4-203-08_S1_C1]|nr:hypothetical protein ACN002_4336 [Escherichia coli]KDU59800.1 hypothetical protein AB21_4629 [Escherichia coli 4-203-08_S1_C1]KEK90698.1 hypothetical protein AB49_4672 [Escherichia coli 4-203-08_S1_C2]KEK91144.1 hypothetical protein AB78_4954 [Escherichia coli 4-203-08_S1_C3]
MLVAFIKGNNEFFISVIIITIHSYASSHFPMYDRQRY